MTLGPPSQRDPSAPTAPPTAADTGSAHLAELLQGQVEDLRGMVEDLRRQRDRLQARVEDLEQRIDEERDARLALERSAGGLFGVRALLRSGVRRVTERGRR